jgi:phosphoserine phosphatase
MAKQLILVTVSGPDKPGITAKLMNSIVKNNCTIEDMGQSVTHGLLSLSILVNVSTDKPSDLLKEMLFDMKSLGMTLDFEVIEEKSQVTPSGDRFILSCVAINGIQPNFLLDISNTLAAQGINIHRIDNVSGTGFKSLDIMTTAKAGIDANKLKGSLIEISDRHTVDLAFIKDNVFRRNKRLIVFDMDSTLIQAEVIDELAEVFGIGAKVKAITERAMNGEINFDQSFKERVALLKGFKEADLKKVLEKIPFTEGVEDFIRTVKSLGFKTALISGGFTYFAYAIKQKLGLDYAFANELDIQNGEVTGLVKGKIINAEEKAFLLEFIAQQESIHLEQVVAIGDGANDLPMLAKAGLGIAFHAKEVVKKNAGHRMSHGPMTSILYFLGIPGTDNVI